MSGGVTAGFLIPVTLLSIDPLSHIPVIHCLDEKNTPTSVDPPVASRHIQRLKEKSSARDRAMSERGEGGMDIT